MYFLSLLVLFTISFVHSEPQNEHLHLNVNSLNQVATKHTKETKEVKEAKEEEVGCQLEMQDGLSWLAQFQPYNGHNVETVGVQVSEKRHQAVRKPGSRKHPLRKHSESHGNSHQGTQHSLGSFCHSRKEGGWYCDAQDTKYKIFCPTGRRVLLPEGRYCLREGRLPNGQKYDGDIPINSRQFCQGKLSGRYCVPYEFLGFHGMIECPTLRIGRCLHEKKCRQSSARVAICVPCSHHDSHSSGRNSHESSSSDSSDSSSDSSSSSSSASNCSPWPDSSSSEECHPYRINQVSVCLNSSQLSLLPTSVSLLQAFAFQTASVETAITLDATSLVSSVWNRRNRVRVTLTDPITTTSSNLFISPEYLTTSITVPYTPICLSFVGNIGTDGLPEASTCVLVSEPLRPICLLSTTIYNNFSTCLAIA